MKKKNLATFADLLMGLSCKIVLHKISMFTMHQCHFKDFLLRNMVKILSKLIKKWTNVLIQNSWFGPFNESPIICCCGFFFKTYEECSRFFSMGIYGVKCKLLATEMNICNDKEFVKFPTCHAFISFALICYTAGMLSFGLLQNQSVGVHWFNYWKKFVRNVVKTDQIWKR